MYENTTKEPSLSFKTFLIFVISTYMPQNYLLQQVATYILLTRKCFLMFFQWQKQALGSRRTSASSLFTVLLYSSGKLITDL